MESKDKKFVSLLYDHYADSLYGIVMRIIKDDEIAKSIMQESFVTVWNNYQHYDKRKAKLFTWLLQIFRNTAFDHFRRTQKLNSKKIQNDNSIPDLNVDTLQMKDLLRNLDSKYQTVVELVNTNGMTLKEVYASVKDPLGSVKSRIRLGLSSLRKLYGTLILILILKNLI